MACYIWKVFNYFWQACKLLRTESVRAMWGLVQFTSPAARTKNGMEAEHTYLPLTHSDPPICDVSRLGTLRGLIKGWAGGQLFLAGGGEITSVFSIISGLMKWWFSCCLHGLSNRSKWRHSVNTWATFCQATGSPSLTSSQYAWLGCPGKLPRGGCIRSHVIAAQITASFIACLQLKQGNTLKKLFLFFSLNRDNYITNQLLSLPWI